MKKKLLSGLAVGAALLANREASACSRADDAYGRNPSIDAVELGVREHLPKNTGIPIVVSGGGKLEPVYVQANVLVAVHAGGAELAGELEALGEPGSRVLYRWRPLTGDTPPGTLTVTITRTDGFTVQPAQPEVSTVTVDDRVLLPTATPATIAVTRGLREDESAPAILCKTEPSCYGGGGEAKISTRWLGVPLVTATIAPPPADRPFISVQIEVFGKDRDGTVGRRSPAYGDDAATAYHATVGRPYDEYCATTTTRVLGVAEPTVTTTCKAQAVDLSVSNEVAVEQIRAQTSLCDSAEYPDGTSEDDPTGEGGGCTVARSRGAPAEWLLAAIAIVLVRARRRQSEAA